MDSSRLFDTLMVGNCALSSRVVLAPMTRLRANDNGVLKPCVTTYYTQRARVSGTLLIAEATVTSLRTKGYLKIPGIFTQEQIRAWTEVVEAVHSKGSYIWLQLWATGRAAEAEVLTAHGFDLVSSSGIPIPKPSNAETDNLSIPRALTEAEIESYLEEHAQAARNAINLAGFDGVEIHGANGFLIDQFTQSSCNQRTDMWGGSIENRARFGLEVTKRVVAAVGAARVGMKLSPWGLDEGMGTMEDLIPQFEYLISGLRKMDIAYLHLVNTRTIEDPTKPSMKGYLKIWGNSKPIFLAGGYNAESAKEALDTTYSGFNNVAVAFGRFYISNPDLPFRLKSGVPLQKYVRDYFYTGHSEEGYLDYPFSEGFLEWEKFRESTESETIKC
jgi:2,4-dienoyl-CoA reductase-like NADH-dependent reductase (Old Yellow Enzyme family)